MDNISNNYNKIESIQIIRAIACLGVVMCHSTFISYGQTGVDFFLIISGLVTMISTERKQPQIIFWKKRFKRIVPLYWLMTIFTSLLLIVSPNLFRSYEFSITYLIKSLCFIPYMHNGMSGPILQLGWTLYYEIFFYFLFSCASLISHKYRGILTMGLIIIAVLLGYCVALPEVIEYWTRPELLEFAYGIIVFYVMKKVPTLQLRQLNSTKIKYVITGISILLVGVGFLIMEYLMVHKSVSRALNVGVVASLIILWFVILDPFLIKSRALIKIGDLSYLIYLMHIFVLRAVDKILVQVIGNNLWVALISVTISVACIILMNDFGKKTISVFDERKKDK